MEQGFPSAASVIVAPRQGDLIAAWRGADGALLIENGDASTVIQAAIDALPITGGKVALAAGEYWLTKTLTIEDKHGVHIEGAARGIVFSGGGEGTSLRSKLDISLVQVFGNHAKLAGITLSNFHLVGSGKANGCAGLLVRGATDLLTVTNVGANHCQTGFHLAGGGAESNNGVPDATSLVCCDPQCCGTGLLIERAHYTKVLGGEFSDCDEYGIALSSAESSPLNILGVKLIGVTAVRSRKAGVLIGAEAEDVTVTGGSELGGASLGSGILVTDEGTGRRPRQVILSSLHVFNNRDSGIKLEQVEGVIVTGCLCSEHKHGFVEAIGQQYGLHVLQGAKDVVATGNLFSGNVKASVFDEAGVVSKASL